ncbi:hypothetical protein BV25DRAFT_1986926 [Artomyces pyxidatus]|uniref:Uncharacterized protein n=1 Tax=Artomyces pyxidatus TaxID=48021 RepID=A0ACB8TI89_9AGAM|nr:hypothetical protein BV25DRAFT_1986926 [Artomyces pyxidatus]
MAATNFKFTISNGPLRRATFLSRPSWASLAEKIGSLYSIPADRVGACYVDDDGDEVTFNSEEELQDLYSSTPRDLLIKLHVFELGSSRPGPEQAKRSPATPLGSSARNTFGGAAPLVFDIDDDWQRLPAMFTHSPIGEESTHGFVETVYSDEDTRDEDTPKFADASSAPTDSTRASFAEKGKARDLRPTVEDDVSSSASVLDDQTPTKPPIHVQVHGLRGVHSETFGPPPAMSTPVREAEKSAQGVDVDSDDGKSFPGRFPPTKVAEASAPSEPFPDPPVPDLDPSPPPAASLSNDIAGLLNSLSTVFVAHPELSENLRQLLRNVQNGAYWNAHRDSVTRAAEDIRRAALEVRDVAVTSAHEAHRAAEEEAGRRVTEAIGNIFRAFGVADAASTPANDARDSAESGPVDDTLSGRHGGRRHHDRPQRQQPHYRRDSPHLHHPHGPSEHAMPGGFPPPPPPPPFDVLAAPWMGRPLPSRSPFMTGNWSSWSRGPVSAGPVPPPPPPVIPPPPSHTSRVPPGANQGSANVPYWSQFQPFPPSDEEHFPAPPPPEVSYYAASPTRPRDRIPSDAKAALELAKQNYKAQKERYRMERAERRKQKEQRPEESVNSSSSVARSDTDSTEPAPVADAVAPTEVDTPRPTSPARQTPLKLNTVLPETQIISNARGNFPQLEMFSVRSPRSPRRYHTISGATRDRGRLGEDMQQVVETLGGMGFTEEEFPNIREVVHSTLPLDSDGSRISREVEAGVVTNVVDKLFSSSEATQSPRPSGSRLGESSEVL